MKRWTSNILCAGSLLIFAAAMGIWVRSYRMADEVYAPDIVSNSPAASSVVRMRRSWIGWGRGTIRIGYAVYTDRSFVVSRGWRWMHWAATQNLIVHGFPDERLNVQVGTVQLYYAVMADQLGPHWHYNLVLPLWLFVPFALPPLLWLRRWRRGRGRGFPMEVVHADGEADGRGDVRTGDVRGGVGCDAGARGRENAQGERAADHEDVSRCGAQLEA